MRDRYGVASDKYCYFDSDVLINLLNIRDFDILSEAEAEFTAERYRTYNPSQNTISDFTLEHLKHLHFHLFPTFDEHGHIIEATGIRFGKRIRHWQDDTISWKSQK